jgi:hypothetical protein
MWLRALSIAVVLANLAELAAAGERGHLGAKSPSTNAWYPGWNSARGTLLYKHGVALR